MLHPRKNRVRLVGVLSFFCLSLWFFSNVAFADVASQAEPVAREAHRAGVQAARDGQYEKALVYFLDAQKNGLSTSGLSYNLAVTYYRLGQYTKAKKYFLRLAKKEESRQLAYFNLGLIFNRQNKEADAIRWFRRAHQAQGSDRIKAMSLEALRRFGKKPNVSKTWFAFASTSAVYDSNVTLANDTLTGITRKSDTATQLIASGGGWLIGNRRNGLRFSLGAYLQKYKTLAKNDFTQLNAVLGQYNRWGRWQTQVNVRLEDSYFGGTSYQQGLSLDNRGKRTLSRNHWLLTRYKLSRLQATNSRFNYLDGWRHQLRLGSQIRKKKKSFTNYYQLELNDRQDRINTAGRFTSFSPTRHLFRTRANLNVNSRWRLGLGGGFRYSAYRGENDLSGGVATARVDRQYRASLNVNRRLSPRWKLSARYGFTRNDSTISVYAYRRYQVTLGINGVF